LSSVESTVISVYGDFITTQCWREELRKYCNDESCGFQY